MAPPADDPSIRTGGLQSQLGADGNPIVHPVEVDATNGHVNPPPPPVPDVEAPVTTAALTAAMQGFAAQIASQFAEMQAQQQKYNDKIDSLHVTSDGRVIPTGRTLFQTPTRSTAATGSNAATNGEKDTDPEVAKLRRDLDAISSKVHDAYQLVTRDCQNPRRDEKESFHSSHRRDTSKGSNGPPSSVLQQW
ncbi:unnamed protein product [Microthlaspi erraticum]|uniref:Uncharacterized protein n=1 Tax=Microthlaspi erraticum TaxID=1685480 RepID=A0A6D2KH46_9BRAS|nr:unnamed protein product [Microthlaspi erraticum]